MGGIPSVAYAVALPEQYTSQWFDSAEFSDYEGTLALINSQIKNNPNFDYYIDNPVVIAVIDTGLDSSNTVFDGLLFNNKNEIADNGIDDDGNGYTDDFCGWDFVNGDNNPYDDCARVSSSSTVADSHGTHVCGIIAKQIINYGLQNYIKILPIKAGNNEGTFSYAPSTNYDTQWVVNAVKYAVKMGADVINMSFTCPIAGINNHGWGKGEALDDTLQAAHDAGVVLVAAAGNTTQKGVYKSSQCSPAVLDNVIGVMNMDEAGNEASSSVSGTSYDVFAPGTNILSTVRSGYNGASAVTVFDGNKYAVKTGTSMASPLVSFMAGVLMIKYDCNRNKNVTFAADTVNYVTSHCSKGFIANLHRIASLVTYMSYDPVAEISIKNTSGQLTQKITDVTEIGFSVSVRLFSSQDFTSPSDDMVNDIKWYVKPCDAKGNPLTNKAGKTYYGVSISVLPTEPGYYTVCANLGHYNFTSDKIIIKIDYASTDEIDLSVLGPRSGVRVGEAYVYNVANIDKINPSTSVYWVISKNGEYMSTVSDKKLVFYPEEKGEYEIICKLSTGETVQSLVINVKNSKKITAEVGAGVGSGVVLAVVAGVLIYAVVKIKRKSY